MQHQWLEEGPGTIGKATRIEEIYVYSIGDKVLGFEKTEGTVKGIKQNAVFHVQVRTLFGDSMYYTSWYNYEDLQLLVENTMYKIGDAAVLCSTDDDTFSVGDVGVVDKLDFESIYSVRLSFGEYEYMWCKLDQIAPVERQPLPPHREPKGEPVGGKKYDEGKPPVDLVDPAFTLGVASVLGYGADKYGRKNYREGIAFSRLYAAIQRHLLAFWGGEDMDQESGLSHLHHAATSIMMLGEMGEEWDDRD